MQVGYDTDYMRRHADEIKVQRYEAESA
jgi:hypothetical protein